MKLRLAIFTVAAIALLAAFGARAMLRTGTSGPQRATIPSTEETSATRVAKLEHSVRERPDDVDQLTQLASAYVSRARETGDSSFYVLADNSVKRALALDPQNVGSLVVAGGLAASRHDFVGALALAEQARAIAPSYVATYGVLTDANVELGRYDAAIAAAQQMADLHPNFASYSRISYIRELYGDLDGAIAAMQQAVDAGTAVGQDVVWGDVLMGNLYLAKNDVDSAAQAYERASALLPDDPVAESGIARLAVVRGDNATAEQKLRAAIGTRPLPEYLISLGDLLLSEGRTQEAEQQYATVRAIEQLFAANGVDTDLELALFNADHGIDPENTYQNALAAYARRGSVYGADTVAWAAYKAGHLDEAEA
jgi:tetratricopeptide (TPR) repeat protein